MLDKLRFKGPLIIASSLVFSFVFYVGDLMSSGESLGGNRGIMRLIADLLNFLADTFGEVQAGYGVMTIAIFGGVFTAVWIWRDPHF
jgi:hypothetical protein